MSLIVVTEFEFVSWRMKKTWFQFLPRLREQWQSIVMSISVCVCLSVREHISGNAWSLPIFLSMLPMAVAQSSCGRGRNPKGRGSFGCLGHPKALAIFAAAITAAFAAKRIIQLPITSCSRRHHSVCQASANRNPENSEHRQCGLSAWKEVIRVIAVFS